MNTTYEKHIIKTVEAIKFSAGVNGARKVLVFLEKNLPGITEDTCYRTPIITGQLKQEESLQVFLKFPTSDKNLFIYPDWWVVIDKNEHDGDAVQILPHVEFVDNYKLSS